jgi:hypothetical protein
LAGPRCAVGRDGAGACASTGVGSAFDKIAAPLALISQRLVWSGLSLIAISLGRFRPAPGNIERDYNADRPWLSRASRRVLSLQLAGFHHIDSTKKMSF